MNECHNNYFLFAGNLLGHKTLGKCWNVLDEECFRIHCGKDNEHYAGYTGLHPAEMISQSTSQALGLHRGNETVAGRVGCNISEPQPLEHRFPVAFSEIAIEQWPTPALSG